MSRWNSTLGDRIRLLQSLEEALVLLSSCVELIEEAKAAGAYMDPAQQAMLPFLHRIESERNEAADCLRRAREITSAAAIGQFNAKNSPDSPDRALHRAKLDQGAEHVAALVALVDGYFQPPNLMAWRPETGDWDVFVRRKGSFVEFGPDEAVDEGRQTSGYSPVHDAFGLTYASYLVWPRSLMQEMPFAWQRRFVALAEEFWEIWEVSADRDYVVQLRGKSGCFEPDPLADYRRPDAALIETLRKSKEAS